MARRFGDLLRNRRLELGLSLRDFCRTASIDPGNFSKMERGLLPPPRNREKLEEYARRLELKPGSDEWLEFFDSAASEDGRIPSDVVEDEELMRQLPLLFRTARGQRLSELELRRLVAYLREGGEGQ